MTIGYSTQFPWGGPTHFEQKILSGKKLHTIRGDVSRRWRPDLSIHHVTGNRTKKRRTFATGICAAVQDIYIQFTTSGKICHVSVDGTPVDDWTAIAVNDGLTPEDFQRWFFLSAVEFEFRGRIIHFTPKTVYP